MASGFCCRTATSAAKSWPRSCARQVRRCLEPRIGVGTFTSASPVRSFVRVLGDEPAADLLRTTVVASIGPVTAEAAAQCGIDTHVMPEKYTIPALVGA